MQDARPEDRPADRSADRSADDGSADTSAGRGRDRPTVPADPSSPDSGGFERVIVLGGIRLIQRALLLLVAGLTVVAAGLEVRSFWAVRSVELADILLIFLYAEVIAMVAVFYTGRGKPFVFPVLIAITALSRLIVLQGKEMDPANTLFEAAAILLLAVAAVVLMRYGRNREDG